MKGTNKKFAVILIAFCTVAFWLAVLYLLQRLLMPKYQSGIVEGSMIEEYYRDKTEHDVVMIGDCELYENISTVELWRKYGITSYIRGSAQQLPWQSYYLLEDTLRCETPKTVVFNVLSLKYNEPQSEAYNRMTLDGMQWSSAKFNAIRASMTGSEKMEDYLFPLLRYHSRWTELTEEDFRCMFSKDFVTCNGYYLRADVRPEDEFPDPMPLADYTLGENAMHYLKQMDRLCKEKGITLVLVKAPVLYPHWYDEWNQQIVDYAEKNGLAYLNFIGLRDEIGLDMSTDTYDAGLHLNVYGAEKLADYFGAWLAENCDLPDHRSDSEIASYYTSLEERYDNEKNKQLAELEEKGELVSHSAAAINETKETNTMKKLIVFALVAVLCLGLVACSSEKDSGKNSVVGNDTSVAETDGTYKMVFRETEIVLGADMQSVLDKLGEPKKYFESESCAFKGLDKVYTYDGVVIRTYPKDKKDYILNVELRDDTVSTPEGISIGDSKAKVTEVYGAETTSNDTSVSYQKGDVVLAFIINAEGNVTSITYTLTSQAGAGSSAQ